jgi:uncharacterized protein (TIGR03663 family)
MKSKILWILCWLSILTGGALLRVIGLNARPMHTDESVHAEKFGELLERGSYRYDKNEFHGPTLNYCTLVIAYLRGEQTFAQVEEVTLRLVPAVFGTLLILTPLFFVRGLDRRSVFFCGILLAFSPAFVYYSRYYIQEMLLVFFTACFWGSLWQYGQRRAIHWMLLAGAFLGLMHATKETFVFSLATGGLAAGWMMWRNKLRLSVHPGHVAAGFVSFLLVSCAFYSSFGTHLQGIVDSVTTYGIWMQRAGGQSVHIHPWYYYLDLVTWIEFFEPLTWNEDGIVALALLGMFFLLLQKPTGRWAPACFFAVYTLLLTIIYCVIPYKTPWSMLSFFYGMAIVAGVMGDVLLRLSGLKRQTFIFTVLLLLFGLISPAVQSKFLAFDYASDPVNPYVYAHTSDDVFRMVQQVRQAAYASGQGRAAAVQVIAEGDDYWPLPWYLRDFSNVGYWNTVDFSVSDSTIILAQSRLEQTLLRILYLTPKPGQKHLYFPLFEPAVSLRPGVQWQGYIRKDLWEKMQEQPASDEALSSLNRGTFMELPSGKNEIKNLHKFSHQAMNTNFEVFVQHQDAAYAAGAARAAFDMLDRLEARLSRFIENSDISRINAMTEGQSVVVDHDTMQCLLAAQRAFELTDGTFDITIGRLTSQSPERPENELQETGSLELNAETQEVTILNPPIRLDLGGIGKGYAVDQMADVLMEWSINKALIHGGASSVLAMEPPEGKAGWPVTLSDPQTGKTRVRLELANEVLGSSGLAKGCHIIDPSTGKPVQDRLAAWIRLPRQAALADALSTAVMIMPLKELLELQLKLQGCSVMLLDTEKGQPAEWISMGERFQALP